MANKKLSVTDLREKKIHKEKLVMMTAYDYPSAKMAEAAGIDMILVGDSLGMAVLGYDSTLPVTIEDMVHHTKAVTRGAKQTMVVADLPFLTYTNVQDAIIHAGRLMQEGLADAVKMEGGTEIASQIEALVQAGIPVIGHIGLTPQAVNQLGGFKVQGSDPISAKRIFIAAKELEQAGCSGIVLECVPRVLAGLITEALSIPTIGIGAGAECDGQVLVLHDLLGLSEAYLPRFAKQYMDGYGQMVEAIAEYRKEVKEQAFPDHDHSFGMKKEWAEQLRNDIAALQEEWKRL
ncbi:3-methyl-2-oxobutanoate hydroxymethyltransferase [Fodinisporobacter ferrooxydans]|uniref:3-methyl-2-oxobutanoate hydroxymethyltransferase n=1 Tax=Fodinisporobacter ferrooxydans TaxID=2901836 RepID=A0ABY4CJR6_9BACL|nr:3-methyl-2-oxobutanoate hydroxymethyltransferase [Alicyclobacillaceae bacterium MYW30-H2]